MGGAFDRVAVRRRKMLTGAALTVLGDCFAVAYCLMTWSGANRQIMLAGYSFGMAIGVVGIWAATRGPAKATGHGFAFAMLGSAIVIMTLGAHWDSGARSPLTLGFLLPILFVASSTARLGLMVGLETVIIGAYLSVVATGQPAPPGFVFLLVGSMLGVIGVCATQARALARQRTQLRALAELDPLTGALNRRGLSALGEHLFPGEGFAGHSVFCMDLDDFKAVNDSLGHAAGDELLQWVVATTRSAVRSADVIARTGGDEFVVVLVDTDPSTTAELASRVGRMLRERTDVSIGWACAPYDGDNLDSLLRAADRRLYERKRKRRHVGGQTHPRPAAIGEQH
ncbi:GGDEF domain-containing protein [Planosporangium thailandense]|uniref:GGDEF domain-containing protein n=1 Tax=Planosporangium thailandense TaxID=765197 RepID=A0ABX0XXH5_9ACTN|nr:GGDEF domain-containing protein [Planosporangium thailandense]NJC70741.1 GGDEF domain-containing protein [Planosporangium thailandense]